MRIIKFMSFAALGLVGAALIAVKLIYGGGQPHPDVSTAPLRDDLEVAIELPFPPGMVAAGPNGEIFYTYHPFHAPQDHTDALLFGWEDGRSIPIGEGLGERLHGVFGITVDTRG
ncbi:MAG: hypothetical protein AAFO75_02810, partial [Pseudomonadota bacterium]